MTDKQKDLDTYRNEIDTIDDKIHQLLLERTTLAHKISNAKGSGTGLAIRPSREAFILKRLLKNHRGDFPFASLARMWREMINAFTLLQAHYELAVYVNSEDIRCLEVARDQFGSIVKITAYDSVEETIAQAENSNSTIAIVPASGLLETKKTKAILRLPLSGQCDSIHTQYDVYAIAQQTPQDSGDNSTLYMADVLPNGAEKIIAKDGKIIYAQKGFSIDGLGSYPNTIGQKNDA